MEERKSRKRKNKAASYLSDQTYSNHASKCSNRKENYDDSNVVISSSERRIPDLLPDSRSARLNGNNDERKTYKKQANPCNKCPSSPECDKFANSIFEKSRNVCKKRKSFSKQKINETVSICPLEISFPQSAPISSSDNVIENSAALLSLCDEESKSHSCKLPLSPKLPLETKFPDKVEECVLSKVINTNYVEKSLLKLPLVSMNICNFIERLSGSEMYNQKRKEKSKVYASEQKIPFENLSEKASLCDYEMDKETENFNSTSETCISKNICHQSSLEEDCVKSYSSSTGTKTIARKSMKKKVTFSESVAVNHVDRELSTSTGRLSVEKLPLALPQMFENVCIPLNEVHSELGHNNKKGKLKVHVSRAFKNKNQLGNSGENILCNNEFDGRTEDNLILSSETYVASKTCYQANVEKDSENNDTCTGTNNRTRKNKTLCRRRMKSILFQESVEVDDVGCCNYLRRSSRTRRAPLRNWCNERARYRIENGTIVFVDITDG